ncbi:MAG: anaerobic ribonucleoside-triphosphate reductase [Caldimicrobium sp.]
MEPLVRKRSGKLVPFSRFRIVNAVFKAMKAVGIGTKEDAERIADTVSVQLYRTYFKKGDIPHVETIQDIIEKTLMEKGFPEVAKAYILYREKRREAREIGKALVDGINLIEEYLGQDDWRVRENSNMNYSLQGLNFHVSSSVVARYWLEKLYPQEVAQAHKEGDFHIHDLGVLGPYCVGWDLYDLLMRGFGGVPGKVESAPPKHFRSALGQIVNFFYTLQGESAGAQAFSNFDTLLAPFVRYDKLSYEEVKQCMQEFLFNVNVPTRVGFQCLSEDTEILTPSGWKRWNEVNKGDLIYTFNLEKGTIEPAEVTYVFRRHYEGIMYNLKNRNQDQLISPGHRVVRQVFNTDKFVLQPIEEILDFKSPIPIPVAGENTNENYPISDEELRLCAWILAEGSIEKDGSKRVSIYQSKEKHPENYEEIKALLEKLNLKYTEREQESWGKCIHIRLSPESSKFVHAIIGNPKKIFPSYLYQLSQRQARLFIETYAKGDGWIEGGRIRIITTDKDFADGLMAVGVLAGYNVSVREREAAGNTKKLRYELTLTQTKRDYIQKIDKVSYSGIIWSVHTKNETVIARRQGQVFITGNTPFTNLTFDLKPSKLYRDVNVIIGGKPREEVYGEFHKEMSMINRAFCELMMAGDAKGRIFTFPIPTYNITKDFDWDNPDYEPLWEMTRKYGIPYFANFVNSDMDPDDARSMCLAAEEEILVKNSETIKRMSIKEVAENYKAGDFDKEGWAECKEEGILRVLSLNPDNFKVEWVRVKRFLKITDSRGIEIITEDGKKALYSFKHPVPVYTESGLQMKFAKDVKKGDLLLVLKRANEEAIRKEYQRLGDYVLDEELAKLLGFFTADGNYLFESRKELKTYGRPKGMQFNFRADDEENIETIRELIHKKLGVKVSEKKDPRYNTYYLFIYNAQISRTFFEAGFKKYGRLPQILFNSPKSVIESFLEFFMRGDGYLKRREIHLNDRELARDLVLLFSVIGKPVTYRERKYSQRIYLQHSKSLVKERNFFLNTPILSERVPGWTASSTYKVPGLTKKRLVGLSTLDKYEAHTSESFKFKEGDVYPVRIKEVRIIEFGEPKEFYDLELERNHLFIHSLGQVSFNCCRLRLDQRELRKRGGGLFGANPLTGSIGVVTINLPRIGYLSTCEEEFFERLERLMELAKISLEIKRKVIEDFTEKGLYPYSKVYLQSVKDARGQYWANHFSTIGIVGMNEACLNFLGEPIYTRAGKEFALKVLKFMRDKIAEFQETTGNLYNLEATPAEGTSYRLARLDKKKFPRIKTQGTQEVPYYTNSVHLPVYYTDDIFEILSHQDDLQIMFTGGTVVHLFVGEEITDRTVVKELVKAIVNRFRLPYFSITPTFSVCPVHGYIPGRHDICPFPHTEEELNRFGAEIVVPASLLNKIPEGAVKILG